MARVTDQARTAALAAKALLQARVFTPVRPDRLIGMGLAVARYGISPGTAYAIGAVRWPDRTAVVDERESLTFAEVHRRSNAIARGLMAEGLHHGDVVAVLARNSAQFLLAVAAATKAGADMVYLNTGFSAPQLADVMRAEKVAMTICDEEFADAVAEAAPARPRVLCDGDPNGLSLAGLADGDDSELPPVDGSGRHVILTSGTTGKPKGAARSTPSGTAGLEPVAALLSRIPLRAQECTVVAAPMFHAWGFAHLVLGQLLGSTLVVRRRFDPEGTLGMIEDNDATALAAVPVMLQRILELPEDVLDRYPCPSLRVVALSGSVLPVDVAQRFSDRFGDVIYNLYGSTEVAYTSIATPRDLREAPGSVGKPVEGVTVKLFDSSGHEVGEGETGRIFVGNGLTFAGYTGGQDKDRIGDLVSTGDMGRFDESGRLYVEGRDDDMIVSGGENVFPAEVEECLLSHPAVADAAVVGAEDEKYGQRLVAHVVLRDGGVSEKDLRAHVKKRLANYKVPRDIVVHDELPRNDTGKVLKRVLRADQ